MEPESRPNKRDQVLARQTSGGLVVLDPKSGHYYSLDEVGARIWELSDGTRTVSEIVATLCREYDALAATVEEDALELLGELADEELVRDEVAVS
jgi:hypothetical protein